MKQTYYKHPKRKTMYNHIDEVPQEIQDMADMYFEETDMTTVITPITDRGTENEIWLMPKQYETLGETLERVKELITKKNKCISIIIGD